MNVNPVSFNGRLKVFNENENDNFNQKLVNSYLKLSGDKFVKNNLPENSVVEVSLINNTAICEIKEPKDGKKVTGFIMALNENNSHIVPTTSKFKKRFETLALVAGNEMKKFEKLTNPAKQLSDAISSTVNEFKKIKLITPE